MIKEFQLRVLPQVAFTEDNIKDYLIKEEGLDASTLKRVRVLRRSVDARQHVIYVNLKVRAYINELPREDEYQVVHYPDVSNGPQVVVVGEGPGGLFASLKLIELGCRPVVVERGKNVHERKKDLAAITKTQAINTESNYCFGEGGAGAYSDGKLYTRSKKRGNVEKILNVFCQHGASTSILVDAHPHIGTDKLPKVIENMRLQIEKSGGEVHFETKMTGLLIQDDSVVGIKAIDLKSQHELIFHGPVILATGHSARDVYQYLAQQKIEIEPKGIAVGVRLEHPAHLIDQIQYHNPQGRGRYLPAAEYSFTAQVGGRGVYSFCMCPGGFVVPAATGEEEIVVNGMSPSNRGTRWSNSGMVVEIHPEDIPLIVRCTPNASEYDMHDLNVAANPLLVMQLQKLLEKMNWVHGNKKQTAPAQRMADFVNGKISSSLPDASYAPGLVNSALHQWLPKFIRTRLQEGFRIFAKRSHGFLTNEATLIAVETRTSSPVRVLRDNITMQHVRINGLFPCGEGAGYAGGIVSAAMDGEKCAEMAACYLQAIH